MLVEVLLQQERSALLGIGGAFRCEWHPPSPNPPSNPVPAGVVARPLHQSERRVGGFPRLWRGACEAGVWIVRDSEAGGWDVRDSEAGGRARRSVAVSSVVAVSAADSVVASALASIPSTLTSIPSILTSHTTTHRSTTLTQHRREPIPHSVLRRPLPQPDQRLQLPPHRQVASPPRPHI